MSMYLGNNCRLGDWCKIGSTTSTDYSSLGYNVDIGSAVFIDLRVKVGERTRISASAKIGPNSNIGKACTIGASSMLEPHLTLLDSVIIGSTCKILSQATIGSNTLLSAVTYVGENAKIGDNVRSQALVEFGSNSIVGDESILGRCVCVARGASVPPKTHIANRGAVKADGTVIPSHADKTMRYVHDINTGDCVPSTWYGNGCEEDI